MVKNHFKLLGVVFLFSISHLAAAGDDILNCQYNEFKGKVVAKFSANDRKNSRAWVPLDLVLCEDENGMFGIVSEAAVGLGVLWDLPLKTEKYKGIKDDEDRLVVQWSNMEDDREAIKAFQNKTTGAVLLGGTSATQVTVFRHELDQVYSNTLFGSFIKEMQDPPAKK